MSKILFVEDDEDLASYVTTFLSFEHYSVERASDGAVAADMLKTFQFDLLILDWQVPGKTGLEITRDYRASGGSAPILMLTGLSGIDNKERGLDTGVDDYLTKPFDLRELAARIRALLRRPKHTTANVLTAGDISLDPTARKVLKNEEDINLLPREFQLLEFMMRHQNQVFSQEALLNRIWPSESDATTEAMRSTMKRLRKKIDPAGEVLRNIHGVGYILGGTAKSDGEA